MENVDGTIDDSAYAHNSSTRPFSVRSPAPERSSTNEDNNKSRRNTLEKAPSIMQRTRGLSVFASDVNLQSIADQYDTVDSWLMSNSIKSRTNSFYFPGLLTTADIDEKNFYERTGCQIYPFTKSNIPHSVHFLSEWTSLWNALMQDESDYVRQGCPMLYYCTVLFFNAKVLLLTLFLGCYYSLIQIVSYFTWKSASTGSTAFAILSMCVCVVLGASAIKGSVFGPILVKKRKEHVMRDRAESGTEQMNPIVFVKSTELTTLNNKNTINSDDRIVTSHSTIQRESTGQHFADSNVASGNLVDLKAIETIKAERLAEEERIYKTDYICNSVRIILSLLFKWHTPASKPQKHSRKEKKSGIMQVHGFFDLIEAATKYLHTIGYEKHPYTPRVYTTYFLQFTILFSTIYVLVNFGGHWYDFSTSDCELRMNFNDDHSPHVNYRCGRYDFQIIFLLGFFVTTVTLWLLMMTLGTIIATLIYGADIANGLTMYWLLRFMHLRRIEIGGDMKEGHNVQLQTLIQRDAYERYLFTYNYMQSATKQWGTFLLFILVLCIGLFVYSYYLTLYQYSVLNDISGATISICFGTALGFVFIVNVVAYANGAVDKILNGFVYSSNGDYVLLGGRQEWIDFVKGSPMYWKIYGFAITQEMIGRILAGGASTIVGGLLIFISRRKE